MAGNSQRRGAMRKEGTKKGQTVGSGGQRRRGLEGKGPTPKAVERPKHKAYKAAKRAEKSAATATRTPRRTARSAEYVVGRNSVVDALTARIPVVALYVASNIDVDDRIREALRIAGDRGLPIMESSRTDLDRLVDGANHQGMALKIPAYKYAEPDDLLQSAADAGAQALIVALDGVTDPRNLGAIVRSAAAFGAHGVVVPERRSAGMTAAAWKTSAGAAARVPVARTTNLTRAIQAYQKAGCFVLGLDADGDVDLPDLDLGLATGPLVIVVGSEGKGLSRLVAETCDQIVSIPITRDTESLNAGIAAGVALYGVSVLRSRA
jgi:23S rRNA (guanosine2251-2'-O)-methyltransferase